MDGWDEEMRPMTCFKQKVAVVVAGEINTTQCKTMFDDSCRLPQTRRRIHPINQQPFLSSRLSSYLFCKSEKGKEKLIFISPDAFTVDFACR